MEIRQSQVFISSYIWPSNTVKNYMIRFFIHPELQEPTHKDYKKALVYTWAMFVIGMFLIPYFLYFWIVYPDDTIKNLTNLIFGGIFIAGVYAGKYVRKIIYIIGFIAFISYPPIMISIYHTGGIYSVEVVWIFVCLISQTIFIDYRVGIIGGGFSILFYSYLFYVEHTIPEKNTAYKEYILSHSSINNYLTLTFVSILVLALLITFARSLTAANKKIEELSKDKIQSLENMLEEKTKELSLIRQSLAKDFHDEMGNKLASISILAQAIALNKNDTITTEETKKMLQNINVHAKELYEGTKDFIWSIDFKHDYIFELYIYLREFGESFFSKININFLSESSIPESNVIRIDPIVGRQVLFICKEIMTNAAKHASCDEVNMQIAHVEGIIILRIWDNGCGFDLAQVKKRGLNNIMRRTEKSGIGIDIKSDNEGSLFTLKIPLPTQTWQ
jgi:signal transduction histidine kinase